MPRIKVYLDNCTFNRPFDDQRQIRISLESQAKLYIQRLIIDKSIDLICSYMNFFENSENPNNENKNSIKSFFNYAVEFIDIDKADIIETHAEELKKMKIKSNDAIHLACAIEAKCDFFITTDDVLLKNVHNETIRVLSPIDFISEVNDA
ncbi:MAG: PIN domain-containing protein [Treponema sp.]|nr:PIN domain-containing protein [Treponema sp.]